MSTKKPKVSIITAYYNRSYCVDQSVDSLLNQTFEDFELLLLDDGSTDDTVEKFKRYNDPRIRIISHPNMGLTNSLIKAVNLAEGEYVAIHGSGDVSFPDRIKSLNDFLDNNPEYGVVAPRFERYDEETNEKIEESAFSGDLEYNDFVKNCRIMHGAVMFRKSVYNQVGGYEAIFKATQDWDLFPRFLKVSKGKIIDELLYRQYKRRDSSVGISETDPLKYKSVIKLAALRVTLSRNYENRQEILDKAYKGGIESVILDDNKIYQELLVDRLTLLVRRGDYKVLLNYASYFDVKKISGKLKLKYNIWYSVAVLFNVLKLEKKSVLKIFLLLKSAKSSGR